MNPLYFFIAFGFGVLLLVVIGKAQDKADELFRKNGIQAQGTVVKNKLCWGRNVVVRPVIEFTTERNELIQALDKNGLALAIPRFSVGQRVILIYERSNPQNFRIISSGIFS